jgi:poly(A) polymerase
VLTEVLPETEKWGIDAIPALIRAEGKFDWNADPMLRLAAIVPPVAERLKAMADRLKMSGTERKYLQQFSEFPDVPETLSDRQFRRMLYEQGRDGAVARLRLSVASWVGKGDDDIEALRRLGFLRKLLAAAETWEKPTFPVKGADLIEMGFQPGPDVGSALSQLEERWIESDFEKSRADLIATLVH